MRAAAVVPEGYPTLKAQPRLAQQELRPGRVARQALRTSGPLLLGETVGPRARSLLNETAPCRER